MRYQAIIFDVDGTAVAAAQEAMPSEQLREITKQYGASANLCAATGRSWKFAKPVVSALRLVRPCIISGGAMIIDPQTQNILWQAVIDTSVANQIIDVARDYPFTVYCAQGLQTTTHEPPISLRLTEPVNALYIAGVTPEYQQEIVERLNHIPDITTARAVSWQAGAVNFDITHKNATKEHAVAALCAMLNVTPENVAGVGDGFNDIHLFNAVGHKIAMGNAVAELKTAADQVIDNVDNDGLAKFITASVTT